MQARTMTRPRTHAARRAQHVVMAALCGWLGLLGVSPGLAAGHASSAPPMFENPVIAGFAPDPSIVRVGNEYTLVTSSFEYFPAIPVYHSRDLVHWTLVGHALTDVSFPGLDTVESSGGVQAATIRYHAGLYYVVATAIVAGKAVSFVVTAEQPAGPWSAPHVIADAEGIDPSLFFDDDGRAWYVANRLPPDPQFEGQTEIWLQAFDLTSLQLVGPRMALWRGCCQGQWAEAPHLYKYDGEYVLMIAEGGTSYEHAISVAVAPSVTGPYRNNPRNPVLTHRQLSYDAPFTSIGHGDLVDTPDGRWFAVVLGMRRLNHEHPILGRETFLLPVVWEREREWWKTDKAIFPVFSPQSGKVEARYPLPLPASVYRGSAGFEDDFTGPSLAPEWTGRRAQPATFYRVGVTPHTLRLSLQPGALAEHARYSFLGIRQRHFRFRASVQIAFQPTGSEEAGLVILQKDTAAYSLTLGAEERGGRVLRVSQWGESGRHDLAVQPVPAGPLHLRVRGRDLAYRFEVSTDQRHWQPVGPSLDGVALSPAALKGFNYTGVMVGLYGSANGVATANAADFAHFSYQPE